MGGFKYPAAALSNLAGQAGGGGGITLKSIQTVVVNKPITPQTETINAVDTSNTFLIGNWNGQNDSNNDFIYFELTDSTTITLNDYNGQGSDQRIVIFVVELSAGVKSLQRGTITLANGNNSETQTITQVDITKSIVLNLGATQQGSSIDPSGLPSVELLNNSTVEARRVSGTGEAIVSYEVVEFA